MTLLVLGTALAAVPIQLPEDEPAGPWADALRMAELSPGSSGACPWVRVIPTGERWTVRSCDDQDELRQARIGAPTTPADRERVAQLAASLLHPTDVQLTLDVPLPPEERPVPAPPPKSARQAASLSLALPGRLAPVPIQATAARLEQGAAQLEPLPTWAPWLNVRVSERGWNGVALSPALAIGAGAERSGYRLGVQVGVGRIGLDDQVPSLQLLDPQLGVGVWTPASPVSLGLELNLLRTIFLHESGPLGGELLPQAIWRISWEAPMTPGLVLVPSIGLGSMLRPQLIAQGRSETELSPLIGELALSVRVGR